MPDLEAEGGVAGEIEGLRRRWRRRPPTKKGSRRRRREAAGGAPCCRDNGVGQGRWSGFQASADDGGAPSHGGGIWGGIWLSKQANTDCERFLDTPVIVLGVFVLLVSIAGLVGSCCRVTWLLWVYLLVMFLLILLLFCFTIFAFAVTNKGAGEKISGKGYREYRLGDYSNWLQEMVNGNWGKISSCLADSKICQKLLEEDTTPAEDFYKKHLSSLQNYYSRKSPMVGVIWDKRAFTPIPNAAEVECVFDAPLEMYLKDENRRQMEKESQLIQSNR